MRSIYKATRRSIKGKDLLGGRSHWSTILNNCEWLLPVGICAYASCVTDDPLSHLLGGSHILEALRPVLCQHHRNRLLGNIGRYRSTKRGPCIGKKWRQRYQSTVFLHSFEVRGSVSGYTFFPRFFLLRHAHSFTNCTAGDLIMESYSNTVVRPGWRWESASFCVIVIELYVSYFQILS